ncbi:hypothetical protein C8R47DRAFT_127958 [Mycena vitilis]|nr:hypothetical protein C8R47DRAFT_127958 [Mycena vitilis]
MQKQEVHGGSIHGPGDDQRAERPAIHDEELQEPGVSRNPTGGKLQGPLTSPPCRPKISSGDADCPPPRTPTWRFGGTGQIAPPSGATFIAASNINHHHHHGEAGLTILHRAAALEALYDSADSFPQPRCHPDTRRQMLDELWRWADDTYGARPVRWLQGPAGAGKSAIMQSLCQRSQNAGLLGGAFFFKRDHTTRGNAKVLFATLAYQLALNNRALKPSILSSAKADPSVVGRQMDVQLQRLIIQPC